MLDLHDLVPAHIAGLNEAERVVDAQRRENADIPLGEHLHGARAPGDPERRDNRRGRSAAQAAGRGERIDAEELVDQAARDAEHGRAAVLALRVKLERANFRIVVAYPRVERDVAGLGVVGLRLGCEARASLLHARENHDLEPPSGRDGLERREAASRNIGELQVLRHGEVAREADTRFNRNDVEEPEHRSAAVFNLHDLVPAHVAGLDEAKRVVDAQRRQNANVTLGEHLHGARASIAMTWRNPSIAARPCLISMISYRRMSRVSIRPRGSYTPRGGRTPMSPSENICTEPARPSTANAAMIGGGAAPPKPPVG